MESKLDCAGSDLDATPRLDSKNFTLCWCCLSLASNGVLFCCSLFNFLFRLWYCNGLLLPSCGYSF